MKYLLLIAFMALATFSFAQDTPVKFQEFKHSFGKIKKDVPVTTEFKFTNTSSKPLIIEVATAECGCTTPEYSKTPIMAGKESTIKVTYNAANEGHFEKKVTVKFAKYAQPVILEISGDVQGS
jgi:hypothetical protein